MCGSGGRRSDSDRSVSLIGGSGIGGSRGMSPAKRAVLFARNGHIHHGRRGKSFGDGGEYVPRARVIHSERSEAYRALRRMELGRQEEAVNLGGM